MKAKLPDCKFRRFFERASNPDEAHREGQPRKGSSALGGFVGQSTAATELASVWHYSSSQEHQQLISEAEESFHSTER